MNSLQQPHEVRLRGLAASAVGESVVGVAEVGAWLEHEGISGTLSSHRSNSVDSVDSV